MQKLSRACRGWWWEVQKLRTRTWEEATTDEVNVHVPGEEVCFCSRSFALVVDRDRWRARGATMTLADGNLLLLLLKAEAKGEKGEGEMMGMSMGMGI